MNSNIVAYILRIGALSTSGAEVVLHAGTVAIATCGRLCVVQLKHYRIFCTIIAVTAIVRLVVLGVRGRCVS